MKNVYLDVALKMAITKEMCPENIGLPGWNVLTILGSAVKTVEG